MALEFLLAAAIFMSLGVRRPLLVAGISLHLGILWVHGLVSFGLTMVAALLLYLRPLPASLHVPALFYSHPGSARPSHPTTEPVPARHA